MKNVLLIVFTSLFMCYSYSNDYIWPEYKPKVIPDSLKNEPAIFLDNRTTVDFMMDYQTSVTYFKRIQILTNKGVEEFSSYDLFQFDKGIIVLKKARIIKPNQIIEINNDQIFETSMKQKLKYETKFSKRIQLIFPKLEAGDVIDIVYQVDYQEYSLSNTLFLKDDLFSLNTRVSLRNLSQYELSIYTTKNMNDFVTEKGEIPTFYWNKVNVPRMSDSFFSAVSPSEPKIIYSLWFADQKLDYETIFKRDYDYYTLSVGLKSFSKYLETIGLVQAELNVYSNINRLVNHFQHDFKWSAAKKIPASVNLIDRFKEAEVNHDLFFKYIQNYLDEKKIKYSVGFTSDINNGIFEPGYVALTQLEYRFLTIDDPEGNLHFLFAPSDKDNYYLIDEIPYYCEGNQAVLWEVNERIDDDQFQKLQLPTSDRFSNSHSCTVLLKLTGIEDNFI